MPEKLGRTPPMGWNSWNTFSWNIDENLIKGAADAMIETGLRDAGYEYVVIDDCWSLRERDKDGFLVPDPKKFPNGIKAVADYVHSKGLKFGIYSCSGTHTCANYPGSFEHEFQDAATFADWGVDLLKYDYCFKPKGIPGEILYRRMSMALRNCGRDILFSACNWGSDGVHDWIRNTGAQMFRSTGDIQDTWNSIKNLALSQLNMRQSQSGVYCWNDLDMLVVGMSGRSDNSWIAEGGFGCTAEEYRTHFSLWAMMNSPLMIGCDIRNMTPETKEILTNKDVIAINQDVEGRGPIEIDHWCNDSCKGLVKPLENGDYAILLVNFADGENPAEFSFNFWDMGLPYASGYALEFYDVWNHKTVGTFRERYCTDLRPHCCEMFRVKLVKV